MIEYIIISYLMAFVWAFIGVLIGEELKLSFKWFALAPISLPLTIIINFIKW